MQQQPYRILIVEDHEDSRETLGRLLTKSGYAVRTAGSVREGIEGLAWRPHVLLVDLMMADGDGLELLHHVPSGEESPRVAVVSALLDRTDEGRVPAGYPYFGKPVQFDRLLAWLKTVFGARVVAT